MKIKLTSELLFVFYLIGNLESREIVLYFLGNNLGRNLQSLFFDNVKIQINCNKILFRQHNAE